MLTVTSCEGHPTISICIITNIYTNKYIKEDDKCHDLKDLVFPGLPFLIALLLDHVQHFCLQCYDLFKSGYGLNKGWEISLVQC